MSVLSTLALLVTTAAVQSKPKKADCVAELEAEIAGLKAELAELRLVRDDWRARADVWRECALASLAPVEPPRHQAYQQAQAALLGQMAQTQQNQAALQQYAAMQDGRYLGTPYQSQGLLGAQALNPEMWRNCVPSRAQVWAASDGRNY
jgi:hypothetical protein